MTEDIVSWTRRDIAFDADGTTLKGWFYSPKKVTEKIPTIVMAHGYGSLKEMYLDCFAEKFAENGFGVIVYDNRNFGDSSGFPRQEINPNEQVQDYQHAITYATSLEEVDSSKIGIWGSSYSGGHVLKVGAIDKRVKCVVSQVPTISGSQSALRRVQPEQLPPLLDALHKDRLNRMKGGKPAIKKIVPENDIDDGIYKNEEAIKWYLKAGERSPNWENYVTLRSTEYSRSYEPGKYISMISPTPLLMLVASDDYITPTDLALEAYEHARTPKKLEMFNGHHFSPYVERFEVYSEAALDWFTCHLKKSEND